MQKKIALITLIFCFCGGGINANAHEQEEVLTLEQSIAIAIERSPLFHSAQEELKRTDSLQKEARSDFFPKLKTGYTFTQLNEPPNVHVSGLAPVPGKGWEVR